MSKLPEVQINLHFGLFELVKNCPINFEISRFDCIDICFAYVFSTIEKKYQEQVRALQADLEAERESFTAATARQRQSADANMAALRKEEARLREQLSLAQKVLQAFIWCTKGVETLFFCSSMKFRARAQNICARAQTLCSSTMLEHEMLCSGTI